MTHSGGQIHVGAGGLELEGKTTVAFDTEDGQLSSVSVSNDGHELLAAGEVFSLDLITGLSGQTFTDAELNEHLQLGEDFDDTTDVVTQDIDEGGEDSWDGTGLRSATTIENLNSSTATRRAKTPIRASSSRTPEAARAGSRPTSSARATSTLRADKFRSAT